MSLIKELFIDNKDTKIFFVGQAGFVIKNKSGKLLAFDLYLSDCVEKHEKNIGFKRLLPKILDPKEIAFDILICSHYHYDHFDYDSMNDLMNNKKTKLYVAEDCREFVNRLKINDDMVEYVKPLDQREHMGFNLKFMECDHGELAPKAIGVIITVDNIKIYYTGDTCLRADIAKEVKKNGEIDVMIAPINGKYGNLNEYECAKLFEILKPKYVIPCHYGMFKSHGGNIDKFIKIMKERKHINNVIVLKQGEHCII